MNRFPLYIPSKGRAENQLTSRYLSKMRAQHYVIVEEEQVEEYERHRTEHATILTLDPKFQEEYQTLDDLGRSKSLGPGPARNFAWEHSISEGAAWHWVMDDNIQGFYRFNRNLKTPVNSRAFFGIQESWCLRYENVGMAGPHYFMFVRRKWKVPPLTLNHRIYSCNLIRNDLPYRWRGRYNEDTILSLDMLEDGWCTALFTAFLQLKITTQQMGGGNTGEFYAGEGTLPKSKMLVEEYPRYARLVKKWGRWHHHVDYRPFEGNKLILKEGVEIPEGQDEYGLVLMVDGEPVDNPADHLPTLGREAC